MIDPRVSIQIGAEQPLGGPLLDALDSVRPIIRVSQGLGDVEAIGAVAAIAMIGRLFPNLVVEGDAAVAPNPWQVGQVQDTAGRLVRTRPTPVRAAIRDVPIAIGRGRGDETFWLGGDDWTACVARHPISIGASRLSIGVQMAAVLLTSELFKEALARQGFVHVPMNGSLTWNLLDYKLTPASLLEYPPPRPVRLALLGAGSVGSSAAGVLVGQQGIQGEVTIVDGDVFDPARNTFRYPAALGMESGGKAEWVAELFRSAGWRCFAFDGDVGSWVAAQPSPGFNGIVLSSVDSVDGRLQVADVLPEMTLSVGVGGLALHIQREVLGDGHACPFCDFVDLQPPLGQTEVWAGQCGLAVERVADLIMRDGRLTHDDVNTVVQAGRLNADSPDQLVGCRLQDLIGRVYAEATVASKGASPARIVAPFVSWAAGVLGAAEVVKAVFGIPMVNRRVDLDLTGIPTGFCYAKPSDRSGRCICNSPIRRRWMRRLHGI